MKQKYYLDQYKKGVVEDYKRLNDIFLTLPYPGLPKVVALLTKFMDDSQRGLKKKKNPQQIVEEFWKEQLPNVDDKKRTKILFSILQFVERQIVLFDALEDSTFANTHDLQGPGTFANLAKLLQQSSDKQELKLLKDYKTRIVLTAHPTQFYPVEILGIIEDLTTAIQANDNKEIRCLLLQLGQTSFKNPHRPTPLDEAGILLHYLKYVFYSVVKTTPLQCHIVNNPLIEFGFWPGGDRDGNPNVTYKTTQQVACLLRSVILDLYIQDMKQLRRRLTFPHMWQQLQTIINKLQRTQTHKAYKSPQDFLKDLLSLKDKVNKHYQGLFVEELSSLICAVQTFGFHFSSIDLRQNSPVHRRVILKFLNTTLRKQYSNSNDRERLLLLEKLYKQPKPKNILSMMSDPVSLDVIKSLQTVNKVQKENGERGLQRYIISNTKEAANILEVMLLAFWAGISRYQLPLDIVPLFETITDLQQAPKIMESLFKSPLYQRHLASRNKQQTVMLGFSDGTKDGGYVSANWEILMCKKYLYELAQKYKLEIIFFDGRGGPPARGGGNTHKFYRAMEGIIKQQQIQLTIQGQTISSNFGTLDSASFNLEQLASAGIESLLFPKLSCRFTKHEESLLAKLSQLSYQAYDQLKNHPKFLDYLQKITPLEYYGELNIASRPPRRMKPGPLTLEDLRAITFVSAWSQMKQNVPGFYGLGTALKQLIKQGDEKMLIKLYKRNLFFRTLLENAMQSLQKSNFTLTAYLSQDKEFSQFWRLLFKEYQLTKQMLLRISKQKKLLETDPVVQASINMREQMVLPLLVIQQYAMIALRQLPAKSRQTKQGRIYKKIIKKAMAVNINASRNSA